MLYVDCNSPESTQMAAEKPTSKGQAWFCTNGFPSDIIVQVDYMTFHLHKLPLITKSKKLNDLIVEQEASTKSEIEGEISLSDFPGGSETFEIAAKFCYCAKIELSATNVAALRCAGEVLEMSEEYSKDNLISRTERFLSRSVFRNLRASIVALNSCENLTPMAEDLGIVERCIDAISVKAAIVDCSLFGWPLIESANCSPSVSEGRISNARKSKSTLWFEQLSTLRYDFFGRVIEALKSREVSSNVIQSCLLHYANKSFPGISRSSRKPANQSAIASEAEQRALIESIVTKLPVERCSISARTTRYLFGLLRASNILKASENCRSILERKIGAQLEQASLDDLLIPSYSYLNDTLYDVDCVERTLRYFLAENFNGGGGVRVSDIMLVGKLMDGYLSEIASDANLKPLQFHSLGLSLPDQARVYDDGLYRAVDLYLKAHPWITDSERERICEVMDFQKLTMEACSHAAQNERLPLRAIVQVLFFEQLQLRNTIAAKTEEASFQRYNVEKNERPESSRRSVRENEVLRFNMNSVRTRMHELERECSTMKKVIEKFDKRKGSFMSRFGCKFQTQVCDSHDSTAVESGRRGRCVTSNAHSRN